MKVMIIDLMKKGGIIFILLVVVFLSFFYTGWAAERIILNNGNELTGEIIQETNEYVVLSIMGGKGKTKIFRSEIADIRKIQQIEQPPQVQEPVKQAPIKQESSPPIKKKVSAGLAGVNQIFIYIVGVFVAVILMYGILFFVIQDRPAGVKIIFLLGSGGYTVLFLMGLMFWPFLTQWGTGFMGGLELLPFLWLVLLFFVFPVFSVFVLFYLFHLRKWALAVFSATLVVWFLVNVAALSIQNRFDFSGSLVRKGNMSYALPKDSATDKKGVSPFSLIFPGVWTLAVLSYLSLPKTRKYFDEPLSVSKMGVGAVFAVAVLFFMLGDVVYRQMFIRMAGREDVFILPVKMRGPLEKPASLAQYRAMTENGFRFFLPSGMSLFSKSEQGNIIIFMDKQKGRLFSIGAMEEREFRLYSLLAYARWNPILLFLKIISLPRPPLSADGMIVSVKEIVFPEGILFLKLFDGSDGRTYEYMLCRRDIFFTGMISGNRNDDFVSERTALELISLIAQ